MWRTGGSGSVNGRHPSRPRFRIAIGVGSEAPFACASVLAAALRLVALRAVGRFPPRDLFLTTEKDAVKLARLPNTDVADIGVVRVAIDFEGDGSTMLDARLRECLTPV